MEVGLDPDTIIDKSKIVNSEAEIEEPKVIPNISFVEKNSINTEISRIFSPDQLADLENIESKDEEDMDAVFSEEEISNLVTQSKR